MVADAQSNTKYATADAAYADHAAIKDLVKRKRDDWSKGRDSFIRAAWRNILFYRGQQWIKWDRAINRWRPSRLPRNTPTPVTNVFASTMDAVMSVFARIEPQLNFRPGAPDEPDDRAAADVAVRAVEVVEDEVTIRLLRQILAVWVGLTSMAWLETGYDPDPIHGTVFVQHDQCPTCGWQAMPTGGDACPECGGPTQPAVDQVGQPAGEDAPRGKMYTDVVPLFEMYFDPSVPIWPKQRACLREKSNTVDDSKARWPHIADSISPNVMDSEAGWYSDNLPVLGPALDENQTSRIIASPRAQNTRVTEQWYWQLPDTTYPDGLLAVIVGKDQVAYAGPLPYTALGENGQRIPFLPFVCFPQKPVPGSAFAKSVADDLAPKQSQRNRWESIIEACGMRMGSPVWLKPNGANITNLTGDPGNIISYNAVGPNAAKPERIPGQSIPMAFLEMLERIDKIFEELAATFDVVKGQRPEGVSAGIALQILQERNLSRYGSLLILWGQAWAEWARQALEIFREFATEPRLLRIKGRDGRWQVQKFLGADLQGRVDVIPEAASSNPRSSLLDRAEMEQLAAMHVIDLNDPEVKFKFLEVYGRTNLTPTMAADTKNAIMEDEAFRALAKDPKLGQATPENVTTLQETDYVTASALLEQEGIKLPRVRAAIDDHTIHLREHRAFAKSESFGDLPEVVQTLVEKHIEQHQTLLIAQAQALQNPGQVQGQMQGGYLQPAPGGQGPRQQPMLAASSGANLRGQGEEMMHGAVTSGM